MIRPYFHVFIAWGIIIWLETFILSRFSLININLFYAIPFLLILRWKGPETWFIAAFFGLTRDVFSSAPFALFGMSAFLSSFMSRWAAIKIFQESPLAIAAHFGFFGLSAGVISSIFLWLIRQENLFIHVFKHNLWFEILPTAIVAVPLYYLFKWMDIYFRISLAERKF